MWIRNARIVLLGARNACRTEQVRFENGFEGGVGVDKSKMIYWVELDIGSEK